MECVNLRERFGEQYHVRYEESYSIGGAVRCDPWLQIIPCKYGHIFPHGGETLAVSVDGHPNIARKIAALCCCKVHQDGDFGELTALFDVSAFGLVAGIIRPRRRIQLSDEERERRRVLLRKNLDAREKRYPEAKTGPPMPQDVF